MYLVYDLGAFLLMKAWTIPRVLSRLRSRPSLPLEVDLRSFRDSELAQQQKLAFFSSFDQKLESLGFHPFCTYMTANTSGKGLSRNYVNPSDPANCSVTVVEVETIVQGTRHFGQASSVHFVSRFAEGRRCATGNSAQMALFDMPPGWMAQRCRNVSDIRELKRRHDLLSSSMGLPLPAIADEETLLEDVRARHRAYFGHQLSTGLYVLDPGGKTLRPTDSFHWRAIRQHYNPFIHPFRVDSFLPAALLGVGLPLLASYAAAPLSAMVAPYVTLAAGSVAMLMTTFGVLLGGLAAGWFLKRQTILWAFLFLYLPLCLVGRTPPIPLFVYAAAILAYYVRQLRMRRRLILIEDADSAAAT